MKVLHVIPGIADRTGGPAAAVLESSKALFDCGVSCTVVTTDLGEAASAARHTRISTRVPVADGLDLRMYRAQPPRRLAFSLSLARALRTTAHAYDIVHIHSLFLFPQYAAFTAASRAGVPFIVSPCGALDPYLRRRSRVAKAGTDFLWQARMFRSAAAVHFKSEAERRLVSDLRLPRRQVVVPNGIDWESYQGVTGQQAFRRDHLAGRDGPIILNVGRLSHKKGLDTLIRAFRGTRQIHPTAHLVLAGPDDEGLRPYLRQIAADEGVTDRVTFVDMLRGKELRAALSAATVWALPSKTENFGSSVVEAMAAGVPIVVSPEVNLASEIEASDAGIVCPGTPAAFAAAINALLDGEERRVELSERARKFARQYDWSVVAPQLLEMYRASANAYRTNPRSRHSSALTGAPGS
jgi:glycosyltransferase involved in cell wall biosynthesis